MRTNWFYDDFESDAGLAVNVKEVCDHCPVKNLCRSAGEAGKEWGVWGGCYLEWGKPSTTKNDDDVL